MRGHRSENDRRLQLRMPREERGQAGVLGPLVGLVGSLQALEALKLLAGFGQSLVGRLLLIDGLGCHFRELRVKRDPACSVCGVARGE